jgi:hypothetical protein
MADGLPLGEWQPIGRAYFLAGEVAASAVSCRSERAADVDQVVGNDAEADPALHAALPFVLAVVQPVTSLQKCLLESNRILGVCAIQRNSGRLLIARQISPLGQVFIKGMKSVCAIQ